MIKNFLAIEQQKFLIRPIHSVSWQNDLYICAVAIFYCRSDRENYREPACSLFKRSFVTSGLFVDFYYFILQQRI